MARQWLLGITHSIAERGNVTLQRFHAGLLVRSAGEKSRIGDV